ncbi:MAG: ribosome biogenesis GTPase Der [Spirochaetia bacterium]|jgi:GTP-binding protein|nr:ribosome biogenesis GTPase Der [Spirochaetia bacterium]
MQHIPTVVLAGRPNVGKSTLFNRFCKKRRSITDPTPGVTRDCVEEKVTLGGRPINLVDTGGFRPKRNGEIEEAVYKKAFEYIDAADCVVLMFDSALFNADDEELINLLRVYQDKIIAVVNKCEGGRNESEGWNLLRFGYKKIILISAEHGDNIGSLADAVLEMLGHANRSASKIIAEASDIPENSAVRIAIVGKPNTGKSTLSNRLLEREASIVSSIAGTTRDVIEGEFIYRNRRVISFDTAGIRRKSKVNEDIEYYSVNRAIKAIDESDIIILMIDAVEGLSWQDKKIAGLATDAGRGIILALNKWDLKPEVNNQLNAEIDRIHFFFGQLEYAPVMPLSAKTGAGINELLNMVLKMYSQLTRKVETSTLNEALARWQAASPPPSGPKTRFSIKYGTQTGVNPIKLSFFVTRPQAVSASYESYIKNQARKTLGFSMLPISIEWKGTRKKHE